MKLSPEALALVRGSAVVAIAALTGCGASATPPAAPLVVAQVAAPVDPPVAPPVAPPAAGTQNASTSAALTGSGSEQDYAVECGRG